MGHIDVFVETKLLLLLGAERIRRRDPRGKNARSAVDFRFAREKSSGKRVYHVVTHNSRRVFVMRRRRFPGLVVARRRRR